jgi:hypothetical protein
MSEEIIGFEDVQAIAEEEVEYPVELELERDEILALIKKHYGENVTIK